MKVIVAGYIDFENASEVPEILMSARPHIEGALEEEGCIAYSWTECHLTPGRVYVYEEWTSSETLSAHLASHWYETWVATLHPSPESRARMSSKNTGGTRGACLR